VKRKTLSPVLALRTLIACALTLGLLGIGHAAQPAIDKTLNVDLAPKIDIASAKCEPFSVDVVHIA